MWRVHKNRVDQGLGPTWRNHGFHESMKQEHNFMIPNIMVKPGAFWTGALTEIRFDNPFLRWHKSFEDYPDHGYDMDDIAMTYTDEFERLKKFKADKKHVAGSSRLIPPEDNDEKFYFADIRGDTPFSHPPDPNFPLIDHGLDEEIIWAFPKNLYNMDVIKNPYFQPLPKAARLPYAPHWGRKLATPTFYKEDKIIKFNRQWNHRLGLETLKMKHALTYPQRPTPEQKKVM